MSDDEIQEAQPSTSAVAATQNASVTVINRHLNIAPFQLTRDSNDTTVRWGSGKRISKDNLDFLVSKIHN